MRANPMNKLRLKTLLGATVTALLLAGCIVGPKYHTPTATVQPPPASYKESPTQFPVSGDWKVAQPQDAMLHGKWWEIYSDPELNALEEQLTVNNQNIKQSFENFMEARTLVAQARAQLFPTVGIAPSYQRSLGSANLHGSTGSTGATAGGAQTTVYTIPVTASWEPDLWGKVRNTIHEAQYNAQLSAADLENERLSEQASLAVFFFELRGQDALQKIRRSFPRPLRNWSRRRNLPRSSRKRVADRPIRGHESRYSARPVRTRHCGLDRRQPFRLLHSREAFERRSACHSRWRSF